MQGREPYQYIKCNFKNIFLPARETILRLLVDVNFESWVSVSLKRLSSSSKPMTRSPGSGRCDPGISFRLKLSEPFMSWSLIYANKYQSCMKWEKQGSRSFSFEISKYKNNPFFPCMLLVHLYVNWQLQ